MINNNTYNSFRNHSGTDTERHFSKTFTNNEQEMSLKKTNGVRLKKEENI